MKKYLTAALLLFALVMTAPVLADRDRGYYSKHHDYRSSHYRRDYHRGYDKSYHKGYSRHGYKHHYYAPPRHYRGRDRVIIHRDYRRDNTLEILGGIYILNEILHHPYHGR